MLQILFLKILNMSLTSALIILLVLIVRILFQKVPKKYILFVLERRLIPPFMPFFFGKYLEYDSQC